jgi:hypothetical protein
MLMKYQELWIGNHQRIWAAILAQLKHLWRVLIQILRRARKRVCHGFIKDSDAQAHTHPIARIDIDEISDQMRIKGPDVSSEVGSRLKPRTETYARLILKHLINEE